MRALLFVVLTCTVPALAPSVALAAAAPAPLFASTSAPRVAAQADDANEQYQYLVGLSEKGLFDRVVKEAETFLQKYPRHEKADLARYRLACALFELHQGEQALGHFQALAERRGFPFEAEVAFRLGQCQLEAGDCKAAESSLARVLALHKDYLEVPATFVLGEARFRCQRYAEAEASYAAVLQAGAEGDYAGDAACGLAWCAYREGHSEQALQRIEQALALPAAKPRADELRFLRAETRLELGRADEALEDYRAVRGGPFADAALRGSGFALAARGDHAGAARAFASLLERFPDSRFAGECALHAGIESLAAGDANAALAALRSKAAGEGAEVACWRAKAESAAGRPEDALATLERALAAKPEPELAARLQSARGDALLALGRGDEAQRAYEKAGSDYALQAAAVASLNAKRPADTVRLAERILREHPDSAYRGDAWLALGEGLFAQQDYARAEDAFRKAADAESDASPQAKPDARRGAKPGPKSDASSEANSHAKPDPARRVRALSRIAWCHYLQKDSAGAAKLFGALAQESVPGAPPPELEEAQFMLARASEAAADRDDAAARAGVARAYDQYLERYPKGAHRDEALFRRARLDPDASGLARLESLLEKSPDGAFAAEARYELGERLAASGKVQEASLRYGEVLEKHPRSELAPAARYGLAWCQYQQGSYAEAADALRPWMEQGSGSAELREAALELLVWSESKAGNLEALPATWSAFASACHDDAKLLRAAQISSLALRKAQRCDDARNLIDALAKRVRDPKASAGLAAERAAIAIDAKDPEAAERELRKALRSSPDDPALLETSFALGEALFDAGADSKAVEFYDLAARDPSGKLADRALYKAGFARLRAKDAAPDAERDAAGAERCFRALVDAHRDSPLYGESLFLLGESQYRRGDFDAAIETLARVRAEAPQHAVLPKAQFRLGLALCRRERWKEGAETLAALMRAHADFENAAEAELWRGRALAQLGQPREARAALERVLEKDKGSLSAQAHLEIGRLCMAARDPDGALSEFLKVAVLYQDADAVSEALYLAGQTLETQGDTARAAQQYRELVEQHPQTRFAELARARLREL